MMRRRDVHARYDRNMTDTLIALGTNLPSGQISLTDTLRQALQFVENHPRISVSCVSRWYRTPAFPEGSGPDFVNGAAALETDLSAHEILQILHEVERKMGRERRARWGPRICDLDLIAMGDLVLPDDVSLRAWMNLDEAAAKARAPDELLLPHPRMHGRGFVLVPMRDVAVTWRHPLLQRTIDELIAQLPEAELRGIEPLP